MDNFAQIRHQAQMADNHTADLEIKRLAQAVIGLSRLCEEALKVATLTYEQSQKNGRKPGPSFPSPPQTAKQPSSG